MVKGTCAKLPYTTRGRTASSYVIIKRQGLVYLNLIQVALASVQCREGQGLMIGAVKQGSTTANSWPVATSIRGARALNMRHGMIGRNAQAGQSERTYSTWQKKMVEG